MDKREVRLDYCVYQNSFPEEYRFLCDKAIKATHRSYSIYSRFAVGAAVWLDNDEIVTGANQENAAYPSGICAERAALFYAGATYPDAKVKAIAIAAWHQGHLEEQFISPCGACRQVMAEMIKRHGKDFDVIMIGAKQSAVIKASVLLPLCFDYNGGKE